MKRPKSAGKGFASQRNGTLRLTTATATATASGLYSPREIALAAGVSETEVRARLSDNGCVRHADAGVLVFVVFLTTFNLAPHAAVLKSDPPESMRLVFLTSGRAAVVVVPGGDSSFIVTVPDAGDVGRYRVSFRADDRVIPHVDRRHST